MWVERHAAPMQAAVALRRLTGADPLTCSSRCCGGAGHSRSCDGCASRSGTSDTTDRSARIRDACRATCACWCGGAYTSTSTSSATGRPSAIAGRCQPSGPSPQPSNGACPTTNMGLPHLYNRKQRMQHRVHGLHGEGAMSRSALPDVFAGCEPVRTGSSSVIMLAVSIIDSSEKTWLAVMDAVRTSADKWRFVYLQAITGHARNSTVWTQGWSTCLHTQTFGREARTPRKASLTSSPQFHAVSLP